MKKECEHTRKSLKKYLHGYVFRPQKLRIDRHLKACVICRSEFEALKRREETRLFMRDLTPDESLGARMNEGLQAFAKLGKIFYRPLWIAAIAAVVGVVYYYVVSPRQIDVELENIVKSIPTTTAPMASGPSMTAVGSSLVTAPAVTARLAASQPPAPATEPFAITIIVEEENTAIRKINQVLRGHAVLRRQKLGDTVKEISGNMNSKELLTLFSRLEVAGRIKFSHTRLESFPSAQLIPFIIKLKVMPSATGKASASALSESGIATTGKTSATIPPESGAATQTVPER